MSCPSCKTPQRPGAERCPSCHAELPPSCQACGAPVAAAGDLCAACSTEPLPAPAEDASPAPSGRRPPLPPPPRAGSASGYPYQTPLIGQKATLARLAKMHARSVAERSLSFMALVGPPGSGKSRIARELVETVGRSEPPTRVLSSEAGRGTVGPYPAIARALYARFGLCEQDDAATAHRVLLKAVAEVLPPSRATEVAHLLGHLCGFPFPDSTVVAQLEDSPAQLESRTFIALRRFLMADVARWPLLLVIDEAERISAESVNLLHFLADGLQNAPVTILCVARPQLFETHPTFGKSEAPFVRIDVPPLTPDESGDLLRALLAPAGGPPAELVLYAGEKLGGVPRALVEVTRLLHEAGVLARQETQREGGRWAIDRGALKKLALPRAPSEILPARLKALTPRRRALLEMAAACGESFWLDAVVALARAEVIARTGPDGPPVDEIAEDTDATRLEVAHELDALAEMELIVPRYTSSIPGEQEYTFAYDPIWPVIYQGIAEDGRRRHHRLIAQWLELRPEGRAEDTQEHVGRHLELAGDGDGAAQRYRRAADAARSRYFNDKAIRLYTHALSCLSEDDLASRIHLWHDLGNVYALKGDNDTARQAFGRMLQLAWVVTSRSKAAVAFNKLGRSYRQMGDLARALDYLDRGRKLFEQANDLRGLATSLEDTGAVLWLTGRSAEALDRSAAALEMRRKLGDKRSIAHSLSNIGNIERSRGLFTEAEACHVEALDLRRQVGDRVGETISLNNLGVVLVERGDIEGARRQWETALRSAEEIGALGLQALLLNNLGEIALQAGKLSEARQRLEEAQSLARDLDDRGLLADATRNLGLLELRTGLSERAREMCREALGIAEKAGLKDMAGQCLFALAECHAETLFSDSEQQTTPMAEEYFRRGIALFRELGNEAELAKGLARFGTYRIEHGDVAGGRALLLEARSLYEKLGMPVRGEVTRMLQEI